MAEHVYKSDTGYANAVRRDYTDVEYCMHVIVAPTILSDSQKDKVFVKFLGSDDSNPLKFKRELEDGYVEYEGVLKAKKGNLIFYKYYVLINGSEEVKEFIYRQGDGKRKKGIWYRTMGSKDIQKNDVYHIYDGVVQGEPLDEKDKDQNILSKWISKGLKKVSKWMGNDEYQKILLIDAELAMKEFMRGLFADINNIRGEELILRFSDIVQGLRKFYYMKEKLWSSVDDFNKTIAEVLKTNLMSLINRFKESPQISDNIVNSGITTAVSIVYLKEQYDITFNTIDLSHLCKALLPNLDKAQRQSADLEDINKSYPTKIREVARYLLSMVKRLLNNSKSPCWLYCIPLLHVLQEGIYPYQDVPKAINHNDPVPRWWGIDNISSELEVYKSKSDFESPSELVQLLHPYFEMDYLLPRTFVASLSFNQFVALDTKHVPPDVMLAAFYYFVKDEKLSRDESWIYLWNDAFSTEIPAGNVKDSYIDFLRTSLESRLGNTVYEYQLKTILDVFCERLDDFGNILQEILTKSALKAFEIFTDYLSLNSFAESTNARKLQQYGKLLHHIFDKEFGRNKLTDTTSVLQHALVWSPFVVFTKVYCNTNFQRVLKDKCKEHMQKSIAIMHSVCQELITGNITIQNLKNILSAESNFKSIVKEIKDLRFDFGTVEASIDLKRKQLLAFESDKAAVQNFVYICENSGGKFYVHNSRLWYI
ncbi:Hypothetical predicted protein [Mytilus galloprovincialis]|nr:Hypothetical predicted protein [Mytilus galloprovincialis]